MLIVCPVALGALTIVTGAHAKRPAGSGGGEEKHYVQNTPSQLDVKMTLPRMNVNASPRPNAVPSATIEVPEMTSTPVRGS